MLTSDSWRFFVFGQRNAADEVAVTVVGSV